MARKFLTPIDLSKLELQNARIQNLAEAPGSPVVGQIYFDTGLGFLRSWNGTAWINTSTGAQGTVGSQGAEGAQGTQGTTGAQGTQGTEGSQGTEGAQGTQGTEGAQGTQGVQGTTGAQGTQGTVGAQGTEGAQGAEGTQGAEGQQGTQGEQGIQGVQGVQGTAGTQGTQGTQGVAGNDFSVTEGFGIQYVAGEISVDTDVIATRAYVDATAEGLDVKGSVRLATAAALPAYTYTSTDGGTLTADADGALAVDGVNVAVGNRVLVKNETDAEYNGIYIVDDAGSVSDPWILIRTFDASASADVTSGMFTFVEEGTLADTGWVLTTNNPITLNTTELAFTQFSGAGTYVWGTGLSNTGATVNVGAGTGIVVNTDDVAIDTAVVVRKYAATITPSAPFTATTFTITHSLNTTDIQVVVYAVANGEEVVTDVDVTGANAVDIRFAVAPADGETYRVVVQA